MRFFILLLLPLVVFATEITDRVEISTRLVPQFFYLSLEVKAKAKKPNEVVEKLSAVDSFIRQNFPDYEGGHFTVNPVEVLDPKTKKVYVEGYSGRGFYTLKLRGAREEELLLKKLANMANGTEGFTYKVNSERWQVEEDLKRKMIFTLKVEALKEIKRRAAQYGKLLNKTCRVKRVGFHRTVNFNPPYLPLRALKVPIPKRGLVEITVSADVVYECY